MLVNHRISWLPSFAWFPRHIFTGSWVIAGNIPWWIRTPGTMWLRSVPRLCRSATETWLESQRIKKLLQRWARSYMFSRCCVNIMQCLERVLSSAQTLVTSKNSLGSTTPLDNLESWIHPPCGLVPSLDHFPYGFVQKMEQLNVHSFRIGLPRDKPNGPNGNQTWLTGKRSNGSPKFIQLEHHPQWGVFKQVMFDY